MAHTHACATLFLYSITVPLMNTSTNYRLPTHFPIMNYQPATCFLISLKEALTPHASCTIATVTPSITEEQSWTNTISH